MNRKFKKVKCEKCGEKTKFKKKDSCPCEAKKPAPKKKVAKKKAPAKTDD